MQNDWNHWMHQAYSYAQESNDPSTQNGALIVCEDRTAVISANTFPAGVAETADRWARPKKYSFIEHAERGAIFEAARKGYSTDNATMVCPWAACADCARAIVVSGVTRLVRTSAAENTHDRWNESVEWGDEIMKEGGVEIVSLDYVRPEGFKPIQLRRNGELITV